MFLHRVLSGNVIRMRSASLIGLVIVDVWMQCRDCHVIHFAETGFPRVPTKLPNHIVSPNTGKRETVRETSLSTCAGRVLHSAGSVEVPYVKRCGICDLCHMPVGGHNTNCKRTYCTFSDCNFRSNLCPTSDRRTWNFRSLSIMQKIR